MPRLDQTHTPGPSGGLIEEEHLKLSGGVIFNEDEDGIDTRNLKRGQLIEITVRGYIGAWTEKDTAKGNREVTIAEIKFGASSIKDLTIIEEPVARNQLRGGRIPGQTSLSDALGGGTAEQIGERLSGELGVDVTVTLEGDDGARNYPRASLTVGRDESAGVDIVMHAETGEVIALDESPLPTGPWHVPLEGGVRIGRVLGLVDKETVATAVDGVVLAIPTDDFLDRIKLATELPAVPEPELPAEPEPENDGNGPIAHDAPVKF